MNTVIEIYPQVKKPRWVRVGALCEVLGEGRGNVHRIVEVDHAGCRVAVERVHGPDRGSWWESYAKLERSLQGTEIVTDFDFNDIGLVLGCTGRRYRVRPEDYSKLRAVLEAGEADEAAKAATRKQRRRR